MALTQEQVDGMDLQTAVEKRAELLAKVDEFKKEFSENGDAWKDETRKEAWGELNDDVNLLTHRADKVREANAVKKQFDDLKELAHKRSGGIISPETGQIHKPSESDITAEDRALAFQGWCRAQMDGDPSESQERAMQKVKLSPNKRQLRGNLMQDIHWRKMRADIQSGHKMEVRQMGTTPGVGGDFIPEGFIRDLEIAMLDYSGVLQVGAMMRTASGNDMPWPTFNDTGNKGRQIDEGTAYNTTPNPSTGNVVLQAYKYTSDAILVNQELLEDEDIAPSLPQVLNESQAERIGRILEEKLTNGTGTGEPQGIVTGSVLGVTAGSATAIDFDDVIGLEHSVDPSYRGVGAGYMLHDKIVQALRLIKDTQGRYIWNDGNVREGTPGVLNGYPAYLNMEMDDTIAATSKTMLFGMLSKYKIRMVRQMRLYRLEELYRANDQDGFVAFLRADGKLLDAGTNPIKHLIH